MKTKAKKQEDLSTLTEQFKNSKSAMVLSFSKLTVDKDQAFRNELREAGATYQVVKNTLARRAVKDTPFEEVSEHFIGVTSVAWTNSEPVDLSKIVSKYIKDYKDILKFKTGVVEGNTVDFAQVKQIASLPSKEELIAKLLFLLKSPAQRLATVLNAVPRDLAIVVKQVGELTVDHSAQKPEAKDVVSVAEEAQPEESAKADKKSEASKKPQAAGKPTGAKVDESKGE